MSYDKIWYADNMQKFKVSDQSIYIYTQYFKFDSIQPVSNKTISIFKKLCDLR